MLKTNRDQFLPSILDSSFDFYTDSPADCAVILCIGGAMALTPLSQNRASWKYCRNLGKLQHVEREEDLWAGTSLENKSWQLHLNWDFSDSSLGLQYKMERAYQKRSPLPRHLVVYVVGGLLDFEDDTRDLGNESHVQTGQKNAEHLWDSLLMISSRWNCNVVYLGGGITPDNPQEKVALKACAWFQRLTELHTQEQDANTFPRIFFHDIYTPGKYIAWKEVRKFSKGPLENSIRVEPDGMVATFRSRMRRYALSFGIYSRNERLKQEREDREKDAKSNKRKKSKTVPSSLPKSSEAGKFNLLTN
jgi:hypothetical protein